MTYLRRHLDSELTRLTTIHPAVLVEGIRATGKTTTATRLAGTILRLDEPFTAELISRDFETATVGPSPVLIDEWQLVPTVWDSVRRAVDADRSPGRFILTGSARNAINLDLHAGAGRFAVVRLEPMTVSERVGAEPAVNVGSLVDGGIEAVRDVRSPFSYSDQIASMFVSGLPEYLRLEVADHQRSLRSYLDMSVARDVEGATGVVRNTAKLRSYIRAYGAVAGTNADHGAVFRAAGVAKATGEGYHDILSSIGVIDDLPGWSNNRLKRMAKAPKRLIVDAAFAAADHGDTLASLETAALRRGALFEATVAIQIRAVARACGLDWRFSHFRTHGGDHEVDLIAETPDGRVLAFETKSAEHVTASDAEPLFRLRDRIGAGFIAGLVVHPGTVGSRIADRIGTVPFGAIV